MSQIFALLKPGGSLILREPVLTEDLSNTPLRTKNALLLSLTIAGFVESQVKEEVANASLILSAFGIQGEHARSFEGKISNVEIRTIRPDWEIGASVPLNFKKQNPPVIPQSNQKASVWVISSKDETLDMDLADENELLDEEDFKIPLKISDDCELGAGGTRKACKNCVCGRADSDSGPVLTEVKAVQSKSACGNCFLGDAFRCASCPSMGLPPYKPGDKVKISV